MLVSADPAPNPGVLMLRTDGRLLVVEQDGEPRWQIGIGERGVHPVTTDPGHLQLVDIDAVVQLVTSQLVRRVDIAQRAGVRPGTVERWRDRYRDRFPAQVAPGLWWWPHSGRGRVRPAGSQEPPRSKLRRRREPTGPADDLCR
jgi:hypothetical protein